MLMACHVTVISRLLSLDTCGGWYLHHHPRSEPCAYLVTRLGVKTRIFHLGDYRRATVDQGQELPEDYFFVNGKEFPHYFLRCFIESRSTGKTGVVANVQ